MPSKGSHSGEGRQEQIKNLSQVVVKCSQEKQRRGNRLQSGVGRASSDMARPLEGPKWSEGGRPCCSLGGGGRQSVQRPALRWEHGWKVPGEQARGAEVRWREGETLDPAECMGTKWTASKGTAAEFWENVCTLSPYTWILNHGFIFLLQKIVLKVRENKWVNFPRWWILGLGIDSTSAWPQISGWAPVTEETCDLSVTASPFPSSLQFSVRTWPALWRENQTFKNYVGSNKDLKKKELCRSERPEEGSANTGLGLRWPEGRSPARVGRLLLALRETLHKGWTGPSWADFPEGWNDTTDFPLIELRARKGVHSYCWYCSRLGQSSGCNNERKKKKWY